MIPASSRLGDIPRGIGRYCAGGWIGRSLRRAISSRSVVGGTTPTFSCPLTLAKLHRSLFLSDLHLGSIGCRADLVLRFLQENRAERYVLVGDVLDLWRPMPTHWTVAAQGVIDHLVQRQRDGAEVVYVVGNHDPAPESAPETRRISTIAQQDLLHETADGRRFLVVHGDSQDRRLFQAHILTRLGTWLDHALRRIDQELSRLAWRAPSDRRSMIEWLLSCINTAFYPTRTHEKRLVDLARARQLDGVICGHFHLPELHDAHGLVYANCGDWVDSFTALAEDASGSLSLLGGRQFFAPVSDIFISKGVRV